jgi:uncharacterized membrane protein YbhN (UPF0104 family)
VTIGLSVAVTVGLWLLHASHYDADSLASRLRRFVPKKLLGPIEGPVASFAAGLRVLGKPSTIARAGMLTLFMWVVAGAVFLLVGKSMGLSLPLWSPFLLSFVVCVAIMVPSSPGFIGVLEASCVAGLSLLGVDATRGLAYGVLYHLTQIVPLVLLGGFYALRGRFGQKRRVAESREEAGLEKRKD